MKYLLAIAALSLASCSLHAETYRYLCKMQGKLAALAVDDVRNELVWGGKKYHIKEQPDCAKFGWRAERQGEAFDFCTATQGYADFEERGIVVQCNQN